MLSNIYIKLILIFFLPLSQHALGSSTLNLLVNTKKVRPDVPLRLHLGCGQTYFQGYINIDFPPSEHTVQTTSKADLYANITELQFPLNSVDEVRSHHVFEHFTRQETLAMLCAWHTWLKIGGIIVIETPDFESSMQQLTSTNYSYQEKQAILRHVFGSHEAHWAIHCDGWYKEKYEHILHQLGYEIISIRQEKWLLTRNIIVTARKSEHIDAKTLCTQVKNILRESLITPEEAMMQSIWEADFEKTLHKMIID